MVSGEAFDWSYINQVLTIQTTVAVLLGSVWQCQYCCPLTLDPRFLNSIYRPCSPGPTMSRSAIVAIVALFFCASCSFRSAIFSFDLLSCLPAAFLALV